jgi:hypothetical protein
VHSWENRSVSCEVELEPGRYEVLPKVTATRDSDKKMVEDVVKDWAEKNPQKLRQVGMNYDIAHAKGGVPDEDGLLEEKKEQEKKKSKKEKEKQKSESKEDTKKGDSKEETAKEKEEKKEDVKEEKKGGSAEEARKEESKDQEKKSQSESEEKVGDSTDKNTEQPKDGKPAESIESKKEEKKDEDKEEDKKEDKKEDKDDDGKKNSSDTDDDAPPPWNAVCVMGLRVYAKDSDVTITLVKPKDAEEAASLTVDGSTTAGATM